MEDDKSDIERQNEMVAGLFHEVKDLKSAVKSLNDKVFSESSPQIKIGQDGEFFYFIVDCTYMVRAWKEYVQIAYPINGEFKGICIDTGSFKLIADKLRACGL